MLTILKMFGRSPFAPLRSHMNKVSRCVGMVKTLFNALESGDTPLLEKTAEDINVLEHEADLVKNDIRNHLPKSLFLPVDRSQLLEILRIQDEIADQAEDIAVLLTLKPITMNEAFKKDFRDFLFKNLEAFNGIEAIIKELHELLEASFGGVEAEKVRNMVSAVALKEHEADLIQRRLLRELFNAEGEMTFSTFTLWLKIFEAVGMISNLSEKLANRVRMTLDLK